MGTVYEPGNYVVAPRNTTGFMLSIKKTRESHTSPDENEQISKRVELQAFSPHARIVAENKIMPIVSTNINNNDFYFPLPIIDGISE